MSPKCILCFLQSFQLSLVTFDDCEHLAMKGYFHWILGQKITQLSDITGYLQELLHLQEKAFALATSHYRIVYFHYCTYNAFKKVDFHVLIENVDTTNLNSQPKPKFFIVEKDGKKFVKRNIQTKELFDYNLLIRFVLPEQKQN
jgi:hypothetical protein